MAVRSWWSSSASPPARILLSSPRGRPQSSYSPPVPEGSPRIRPSRASLGSAGPPETWRTSPRPPPSPCCSRISSSIRSSSRRPFIRERAPYLLIARLETEGLLSTPLAELADQAHARRLEVLLEFHDRSELRQVGGVAADMFGVNVRDLDTLRMAPAVADATLRAAASLRPLLGLSGVASPADALRFWDAGVDGILVGSSVARASDPGAFLQSLHRPPRGAPA